MLNPSCLHELRERRKTLSSSGNLLSLLPGLRGWESPIVLSASRRVVALLDNAVVLDRKCVRTLKRAHDVRRRHVAFILRMHASYHAYCVALGVC